MLVAINIVSHQQYDYSKYALHRRICAQSYKLVNSPNIFDG